MDAPYDFEDDYLPPYDPEDIDIPGDMTNDTPGTPIDMPDAIPTDGFMVPPSPDATPAAPTLPDTSIGLNVGMRLLLIGSSDSDAYYLSAKLTLDSVGAPYDSVFAGVIPELETLAGGMLLHALSFQSLIILQESMEESLWLLFLLSTLQWYVIFLLLKWLTNCVTVRCPFKLSRVVWCPPG